MALKLGTTPASCSSPSANQATPLPSRKLEGFAVGYAEGDAQAPVETMPRWFPAGS